MHCFLYVCLDGCDLTKIHLTIKEPSKEWSLTRSVHIRGPYNNFSSFFFFLILLILNMDTVLYLFLRVLSILLKHEARIILGSSTV